MRRALATPALAIAACLLLAPAAHATYDPLGSGTTRLVLDKRFSSFLKEDGIKLTAQEGAKRKGKAYSLPVSGGNLDPTLGKGEIDNAGTLVFQGARRKVPLRAITVKTKHSPLAAKVGGSQLKLATSAKLSARRAGFGTSFSAKALRLSAKVATRLNKKLRPKTPFSEGQPLGKLVANAQPKLATILESGRATLVFDPAFVAKLDGLFVSLNPISPAERLGRGNFTFPILAGGALAPDGSEGTLRTGGDVEMLQLGSGQVFWHEFWLDLGARSDTAEVDVEPTPAFPGKLGRVGVLDLGAAAFAADPAARTIAVAGAPLSLQAGAAASLNEAFAQGKPPAFAAGETVGSLTFTAQAQ